MLMRILGHQLAVHAHDGCAIGGRTLKLACRDVDTHRYELEASRHRLLMTPLMTAALWEIGICGLVAIAVVRATDDI